MFARSARWLALIGVGVVAVGCALDAEDQVFSSPERPNDASMIADASLVPADVGAPSIRDGDIEASLPRDGSTGSGAEGGGPLGDARADAASDATADAAVDAGSRIPSIWAFDDYCGSTTGVACASFATCPRFGNGPSGRTCAVPFERCLEPGAPPLATKVFSCIPNGKRVWLANAMGSVLGGLPLNYPACPAAGANGVAGQECAPEEDRCKTADRVFRCVSGGARMFVFDGHCNDPAKTVAYLPACAAASAPVCPGTTAIGSACATEFERCTAPDKVFVCVQR